MSVAAPHASSGDQARMFILMLHHYSATVYFVTFIYELISNKSIIYCYFNIINIISSIFTRIYVDVLM